MNAMCMTVRGTETKGTPKWARTPDGIVRRWEERHDGPQTLSALKLPDRLRMLFVIGCARSVRVEDEDRGLGGEGLIRKAVITAERDADRDRPVEIRGDFLAELNVSQAACTCVVTRVAVAVAKLLLVPPHFIRGSRYENAKLDVYRARLAVNLVENRTHEGRQVQSVHGAGTISTRAQNRTAATAVRAERTRQGQLLAGIVGPGWHLAAEWRTDTTVPLARAIYDTHEFSAMPVLADALQDAGCDDEGWLARMRDPSWPWCRGCHVLDSLLPDLMSAGV